MTRDQFSAYRLFTAGIVFVLMVSQANVIGIAYGFGSLSDSPFSSSEPGIENTNSDSVTASIQETSTATKTTEPNRSETTTTQTTYDTETSKTASTADAQPEDADETGAEKPHPKVAGSVLDQVNDSSSTSDSTVTTASTSESSDRVHVVIETKPGHAGEVTRLIQRQHGAIQVQHENEIRAKLPSAALDALTSSPAVRFIRSPIEATPQEITSEGVSNINARTVHERGYTGDEVTVAVIDNGFNTSNPNIRDNVVKTKDYTGEGIGDGSYGRHGTATSEIVTDTAPDVNLVLIRIRYVIDIKQAIDYVETQTEADVVSMSMGIRSGPFDGSSELDQKIAKSVQNGTTWFVSTGNAAGGKHLNQTFSDSDRNDWHNFTATDELLNINPASNRLAVYVNWNDWPTSDQDYDVYLYDPDGNPVDWSKTQQSGYQHPLEAVALDNPTHDTYYLGIRSNDSNRQADFDIFANDGTSLEYYTNVRSVKRPATEERVIAVGAVNYQDNTLESFSSRGPTIDGQRKPDIVGPDGVTTSETDPFYGTSAATPYAAGVAALMESANSSLTPSHIESRLKTTGATVTSGEPNNRTGWGLVDAAAAIAPQNPTSTVITPDSISQSEVESISVDVAFDAQPKDGEITVKLTGSHGATVTDTASVDTSETTTTVTGIDVSSLSDGDITATAKVTDSNGYTNPAGFTATSTTVPKDTNRPTVTHANVQGAPINKSDAGTSKGVTVTFDEPMAQETTPTVEVANVGGGPYTVSGNFVDKTTWSGTVTIPDTGEEVSAKLTVSGGADSIGNIMEPTTAKTFSVDTVAAQNPELTAISSQPINRTNENTVPVKVGFTSPPDQGTLTVRLTDERGATTSTTTPVNATSTTTYATADVSELTDGDIIATAKLVDTAGNENPDDYTADSPPVVKDTVAPTIASFAATKTDQGDIQIGFESDELLSTIRVSVTGTAGNTETITTSDFTGDGSGTNPYTATYAVSQEDEYTVTLDKTIDEHGNDRRGDERTTVDYLPPAIQSVSTHDGDADGSVERLILTFTETLNTQKTTLTADAIALSKGSITNVLIGDPNGKSITLGVSGFSGTGVRPDVTVDASANDVTITDLAGNLKTGTQTVTNTDDAAPPVITDLEVKRANSKFIDISIKSSEQLHELSMAIDRPNGQTTRIAKDNFDEENETYTTSYEIQGGDGQYTVSLSSAADASNNDAHSLAVRTVTFESTQSGGGDGSGGGGGSANVPPPSVQVDTTEFEPSHIEARVTSARADAPGRIRFTNGLTGGDVTFRELSVAPKSESPEPRFFLDAQADSSPGTDIPPLDRTSEALGYLSITPRYIQNSELATVSVTFDVSADVTDTPENVVLYQYRDGAWEQTETSVRDKQEEKYRFRASMSTAGTYAVGITQPSVAVHDATLNASAITTGETVAVSVTVENTGSETETYAAELSIDGEIETTEQVAIAPSEKLGVELTHTFDNEGEYEIAVGSTSAGTLVVTASNDTQPTDKALNESNEDERLTQAGTGGTSEVPGFTIPTTLAMGVIVWTLVRRQSP